MDIDIDIPPGTDLTKVFGSHFTHASTVSREQLLTKHPCGVYFQKIPVDRYTGFAAVPYKDAENNGYVKFDFLHLSLLKQFDGKRAVIKALEKRVKWELFEQREVVEQLFQLQNSWEIISLVKPTNIHQLADVLALIRPNKRQYVREYLRSPERVRDMLYRKTGNEDKSSFRLGHSYAYAYTILLQLSLF